MAARSVTIRSITRSSGPSSPASLRAKLSVDSTHSVTTGMPISSHDDEVLQLVRPGLIAGHQRLTRRVGPGPAPVAVGEHRHVPGQARAVEFGDQAVLVRRVQQSRRVQPVHELPEPVESGHGWQTSPARARQSESLFEQSIFESAWRSTSFARSLTYATVSYAGIEGFDGRPRDPTSGRTADRQRRRIRGRRSVRPPQGQAAPPRPGCISAWPRWPPRPASCWSCWLRPRPARSVVRCSWPRRCCSSGSAACTTGSPGARGVRRCSAGWITPTSTCSSPPRTPRSLFWRSSRPPAPCC